MDTDIDLERRFGGLARLYGLKGAAAIRGAHVAVVGIGGVGSWAAEALARSGVGRISLIDFDQVGESNINRQIQAESATVGQAKVDAMAERIARINPLCQVHKIEEFATPENWAGLALQAFPVWDAVIDACDAIKTKTTLAAWARLQKDSVFISAGAAGGKRHAYLMDIADLADTTHDPLLAQVRYHLRRTHGAPAGNASNGKEAKNKRIGVACVFSREAVASPDLSSALDPATDVKAHSNADAIGDASVSTDSSLNCHGYGSVVSVTASFGMCAAGWVLDALAQRNKER